MTIKLLITTEDDTVVSQYITSEWNVERDKMQFFVKLQKYMIEYIGEHAKINKIHIKKLQSFDGADNLLMEVNKSE
jgi:hypothetical protein